MTGQKKNRFKFIFTLGGLLTINISYDIFVLSSINNIYYLISVITISL